MNPLLYYSLAIYLIVAAAASSSKDSTKPDNKPCTITSPTTGSFFDLTGLQIQDPAQSKAKHPRDYSWNATGYDVGYNFTINFCGPVVEPVEDVVGIEKNLWRNVSAYYKQGGKVYSMGQQNSALVMRGRKLVLNYTDDPLAPTLQLSFVGTMDECTYFFEGRSNAACATANTTKSGSLNPSGVFGVIATIAIIVYFVGGCVYNRAVLQQRGWQQVPNYNMWASIFGFFKNLFIILTSSCARFMPSRRGYSRVNNRYGNINGRGRARGDSSDAENRLIDELNEEWED
ncbi:putative mannose 6-phosphate receptor-like protein [Pseudocercospora fuligena]|uniref:Putative mannose 6-phosphate receptor-like protein n=1 Tax=Pseudocercospora fuligena TaxID=685502 RepID=A0A8H6REW6_9PEZI|nr:putative mannose 6-phosphate receptor-like protein [Pseudocercospora fuligena]